MTNLNVLNRETLIDIILDLDDELSMNQIIMNNYEERIIDLQTRLADMDARRIYWKKQVMANKKANRVVLTRDNTNTQQPLEKNHKREIPMVPGHDGVLYPLDVIRKAQGNTLPLNYHQRIPKVQQRNDVPQSQRKEETKPRKSSDGGNWLGSAHVHHKRNGVGYEVEYKKDVKDRHGAIKLFSGDVYRFPDLKSIEDFYVEKGLKRANWRANNLSTAITRRGGYMEHGLWKYVDLENQGGI